MASDIVSCWCKYLILLVKGRGKGVGKDVQNTLEIHFLFKVVVHSILMLIDRPFYK